MVAYVTPTLNSSLSQTAFLSSFEQDRPDAENSAISTNASLDKTGDNGDNNYLLAPLKTIGCPKVETIKKQLDKDGSIRTLWYLRCK